MVEQQFMSADQVEWNMAGLLNFELSRLRNNANSLFIAGKYREAIDTLITMKMTGIHVFTKDERKALDNIEKELISSIMGIKGANSFNPELNHKAVEAALKIRTKLPEYNEKLMDFLHAHGFLGSYKRDSGRMRI